MLKPVAFGNGFAGASIIFYLLLYVLKAIAPPFFNLVLNSRFFGANLATQTPNLDITTFLGFLIVIGVTSWIVGYLIAVIYNGSAQKN